MIITLLTLNDAFS